MSSAAATTTTPRPSVFISYASEDRAAARALRDALTATGLDVWYDESELGGGDAWDQKIRRQIRDCDYFMPMISAATEKRKEGYFRREWRLAAERTLDMADDVMFLLPVVIDGTNEGGARVPDKFLAVQWLRLPGGLVTPALETLCRRLLAGEHSAPPRPAFPSRPPARTYALPPPLSPSSPPPLITPPPHASRASGPAQDEHHGPPPMPPFPHPPKKGEGLGHGLKFLAEALWWNVSCAWILIKRAPKWVRVLLSIWFIFFLFSRCSRDPEAPTRPAREKKPSAASQSVKEALKKAGDAKKDQDPNPNFDAAELGKIGQEIARKLSAGLDKVNGQQAKPLALVPFATGFTDETVAAFSRDVFTAVYGRIMVAQPGSADLTSERPAAFTDAALVALGKKIGSPLILAARPAEGVSQSVTLRLLRTDDGAILWTETYVVDPARTNEVAGKISEAILAALPKK
jgi:hypothetical protein